VDNDTGDGAEAGAYTAHPLVEGFPGTSASHGGFGWSSLWLLQDGERRVLVDAGPPSYIPLIHEGLARHGLTPDDITDVLVTHLHWDHVANVTMFPRATTWVGEEELAWALDQPAGTPFVADLHAQELRRRTEGVERIRPGREILPGIHAVAGPGHTPHHLAFLLERRPTPIVFAGDAVKNVAELSTLRAASTMDAAASSATIDRLRSLMRDTGAAMVPGHDVELSLGPDGAPIRERIQRATIGFVVDASGEQDRSIS